MSDQVEQLPQDEESLQEQFPKITMENVDEVEDINNLRDWFKGKYGLLELNEFEN